MTESAESRVSRRGLVKAAAATAGLTVGLRALRSDASAGSTPQGPHRWAMVIDQDLCTGCEYCTMACRAENDVHPEISWNKVIRMGAIGEREVFLPRPCMHCEQAPCVDVCPVKASYHRSDGIVMTDYDRCIGCRYCEVACPYLARAFNWETFDEPNPAVPKWGQPGVERRPRGVVEKCTFCFHRIDRGLAVGLTPGVDSEATPACVVECPVGARKFGDLNDPESEVSKLLQRHPSYRLREDLGTGPRVYYLAAHGEEVAS